MIRYQRQQQLLSYLRLHKSATIKTLSGLLYISEASVRRDIAALEEQGLVRRKYGGVVLAEYEHSVMPLALRDPANAARKEQIARRAADLVEDGMTVMLDASSTARRLLPFLQNKKNLRIITNNASLFDGRTLPHTVHCTGGRYDSEGGAFLGPAAEEFLRSVRADILFFSSQGLDETGVISDASEEETALRRAMLAAAGKKYFLCDSSKLGQRRTFILCTKDELDGVICDGPLPWEESPAGNEIFAAMPQK